MLDAFLPAALFSVFLHFPCLNLLILPVSDRFHNLIIFDKSFQPPVFVFRGSDLPLSKGNPKSRAQTTYSKSELRYNLVEVVYLLVRTFLYFFKW